MEIQQQNAIAAHYNHLQIVCMQTIMRMPDLAGLHDITPVVVDTGSSAQAVSCCVHKAIHCWHQGAARKECVLPLSMQFRTCCSPWLSVSTHWQKTTMGH